MMAMNPRVVVVLVLGATLLNGATIVLGFDADSVGTRYQRHLEEVFPDRDEATAVRDVLSEHLDRTLQTIRDIGGTDLDDREKEGIRKHEVPVLFARDATIQVSKGDGSIWVYGVDEYYAHLQNCRALYQYARIDISFDPTYLRAGPVVVKGGGLFKTEFDVWQHYDGYDYDEVLRYRDRTKKRFCVHVWLDGREAIIVVYKVGVLKTEWASDDAVDYDFSC